LSSRRRHTRSTRDWSSDVCSSDLERSRYSRRTELAMNFDRIRLRNGVTRPFDGYIENVRTPNGEDVRVDNEGIVSEQTSQTTTKIGSASCRERVNYMVKLIIVERT